MLKDSILNDLYDVLQQRKFSSADESYVASLYQKGLNAILIKIGEESVEIIVAAKDGKDDHIIHEVADLWFHSLVLLSYQGIHVQAVLQELQHRFGISGHTEKKGRNINE